MEENFHFTQIISGSLPGPFFFFFYFIFLSVYYRNRNLSIISTVMQDNSFTQWQEDLLIWCLCLFQCLSDLGRRIEQRCHRTMMNSHFLLLCFSHRIILTRIITYIKKYIFAMKEREVVCLCNRFRTTSLCGEVMCAISSSTPTLSAGPITDLLHYHLTLVGFCDLK